MLQNIETNGRFGLFYVNICTLRVAHANKFWTGELEKMLFERMCITQRLKGLISLYGVEGLKHRLKSFADGVRNYLNPTVKGTLSEDLTSMTMQQGVLHGEDCWLEKDVLKCLEELLVCTGNLKSPDTRVETTGPSALV